MVLLILMILDLSFVHDCIPSCFNFNTASMLTIYHKDHFYWPVLLCPSSCVLFYLYLSKLSSFDWIVLWCIWRIIFKKIINRTTQWNWNELMIQIALDSSQQSTFHRFHFPLLSVLTTDGSSYIRRSTIPSISTALVRTTKQGSETTTFGSDSEKMHQLTSSATYRLRIEVQASINGQWYWAEFSSFRIDSESGGYACARGVLIWNYRECFGILHRPNGPEAKWMKFSTWDMDNDLDSANCGQVEGSGNCSTSAMVRCAFWSPRLDRITDIAVWCTSGGIYISASRMMVRIEGEQILMWTHNGSLSKNLMECVGEAHSVRRISNI